MKHKQRTLISVVGVLLVVAVIGFVITGMEPLFGQGQGQVPVPDLTGEWQVNASFYFFDSVLDPDEEPLFIQPPPGEGVFNITYQTARVFAGTDFDESKQTGVILPDGTVSIQWFEQDELRGFMTGSIDRRGTKISGFMHAFDDFWNDSGSQQFNMGSGVFEMVKVN